MSNYLPIDFSKHSDYYAKKIKEIETYFKDNFDITVYLAYGTLLGAVQRKTFLYSDDDIDLTYLSNKTTQEERKEEMIMIYEKLKKDELLIKDFNKIGQAHLYCPDKSILIDLWTSWIEKDRYYLIPWINGYFHKDIVLPFSKGILNNIEFIIPNNPLPIIQFCYGNWERKYENWTFKDRKRCWFWLQEEK